MKRRKVLLEDVGLLRNEVCGEHADDSPSPRLCAWDGGLCYLDSSLKCGGYVATHERPSVQEGSTK